MTQKGDDVMNSVVVTDCRKSMHNGPRTRGEFSILGMMATALIVASGMLIGCDEPGAPQAAVKRAALAVAKADLGALRKTLDGSARRRFGDQNGLQTLSQFISGRNLETGVATLRYRTELEAGFDHLRIYAVPITEKGGATPVMLATVTCSVHYVSPNGYSYLQPFSQAPSTAPQLGKRFSEIESCRVSDVKMGDSAQAAL